MAVRPELNRLGAIRHPLVDLAFVEPPITANLEGWNFASPKKPVDGARMHLEIISQFFRRHNDHWCVCCHARCSLKGLERRAQLVTGRRVVDEGTHRRERAGAIGEALAHAPLVKTDDPTDCRFSTRVARGGLHKKNGPTRLSARQLGVPKLPPTLAKFSTKAARVNPEKTGQQGKGAGPFADRILVAFFAGERLDDAAAICSPSKSPRLGQTIARTGSVLI